jgi:hypothetical protein
MNNDRRRESREEFTAVATVQPLAGKTSKANGEPFEAIAVDLAPKGLRLLSGRKLEVRSMVKVEVSGATFRCEVCYCLSEPGESFSIGRE